MNSSQVLAELNSISGQLNPLLEGLPLAPDFFKQGLETAFGNRMPLLKEGAAMAEGLYSLPGNLLRQYDSEFGNTFGGASGLGRTDSILRRIGNQSSLVDLISQLNTNQGNRIGDLANTLLGQYKGTIDAKQSQYNMKLPIFQQLKSSEDAAAARAAAARASQMAQQALRLPTQQMQTPVQAGKNYPTGGVASAPNGGVIVDQRLAQYLQQPQTRSSSVMPQLYSTPNKTQYASYAR